MYTIESVFIMYVYLIRNWESDQISKLLPQVFLPTGGRPERASRKRLYRSAAFSGHKVFVFVFHFASVFAFVFVFAYVFAFVSLHKFPVFRPSKLLMALFDCLGGKASNFLSLYRLGSCVFVTVLSARSGYNLQILFVVSE